MAYIQERKTDDGKLHYRVQIRLKGFPTQSATFERKTDAKKWAQQTEAAIREGRHFKFVESKKHTLGKLIDRYIRDILPTKPKSQKKQTAQLGWWSDEEKFCDWYDKWWILNKNKSPHQRTYNIAITHYRKEENAIAKRKKAYPSSTLKRWMRDFHARQKPIHD